MVVLRRRLVPLRPHAPHTPESNSWPRAMITCASPRKEPRVGERGAKAHAMRRPKVASHTL
eukprot:3342649-Rhodomonas_salina.1